LRVESESQAVIVQIARRGLAELQNAFRGPVNSPYWSAQNDIEYPSGRRSRYRRSTAVLVTAGLDTSRRPDSRPAYGPRERAAALVWSLEERSTGQCGRNVPGSQVVGQPHKITPFSVRCDLPTLHKSQLLQHPQRWPVPGSDSRPEMCASCLSCRSHDISAGGEAVRRCRLGLVRARGCSLG
jgi:hypothetical protein